MWVLKGNKYNKIINFIVLFQISIFFSLLTYLPNGRVCITLSHKNEKVEDFCDVFAYYGII